MNQKSVIFMKNTDDEEIKTSLQKINIEISHAKIPV